MRMEFSERTKNVQLLLRISKSIDKDYSENKMRLYNSILSRIKLKGLLALDKKDRAKVAEKIIASIGIYFELPKTYAMMKIRKRKYVKARQIAITMIMDNVKLLTYNEIGKYFEKNHATLIHSHKAVDNMIDTNIRFKQEYFALLRKLSLQYTKYTTRNI